MGMTKDKITPEHIAVCICTFKRPLLLKQLLETLLGQVTNGQFTYSIVVVDNDSALSARPTVTEILKTASILIEYHAETKQNISRARNKAVENAHGQYVAFIDDDEYPSETWLHNLYTAFNTLKPSGGVLGPVVPYYPEGTPQWLIKSEICDRPDYETGTLLDWKKTRTGNVLMRQKIFSEEGFSFDEQYGRTGGEDKALFRQLIQRGYSFIWCHEAEVYEVVLPERWKLSHHVYRNLMSGGFSGSSIYNRSVKYFGRSFISLLFYSALLLMSIFRGRHIMFKHFIRVVYDFGRVMGCLGIVLVEERID